MKRSALAAVMAAASFIAVAIPIAVVACATPEILKDHHAPGVCGVYETQCGYVCCRTAQDQQCLAGSNGPVCADAPDQQLPKPDIPGAKRLDGGAK